MLPDLIHESPADFSAGLFCETRITKVTLITKDQESKFASRTIPAAERTRISVTVFHSKAGIFPITSLAMLPVHFTN